MKIRINIQNLKDILLLKPFYIDWSYPVAKIMMIILGILIYPLCIFLGLIFMFERGE